MTGSALSDPGPAGPLLTHLVGVWPRLPSLHVASYRNSSPSGTHWQSCFRIYKYPGHCVEGVRLPLIPESPTRIILGSALPTGTLLDNLKIGKWLGRDETNMVGNNKSVRNGCATPAKLAFNGTSLFVAVDIWQTDARTINAPCFQPYATASERCVVHVTSSFFSGHTDRASAKTSYNVTV